MAPPSDMSFDFGLAIADLRMTTNSSAVDFFLTDAMPQMVWSTTPDGYHDYYNARWYEFTGVAVGSTDGEAWAGMFHAEDQPAAWEKWRHSLATGDPYETEYRLRHHSGEYRWTLGRAMPIRDRAGNIVRWIGTCTDIDKSKKESAQIELLSRELSHRIKNIFAVVGGLIGLSARNYPAAKEFADELRKRISALSRAHEFVRPHSEQSAPQVSGMGVMGMMADLLSAYPAHSDGRLRLSGDDVRVDDRGATPLALAFHELATNSAKYGALAADAGEVAIEMVDAAGSLTISWRESGGDKVIEQPQREGFGTKLVDMSIQSQLDGTITRNWHPDGLIVTIVVPTRNLTRTPS